MSREETTFAAYKDFDGIQRATKLVSKRGGSPYLTAELYRLPGRRPARRRPSLRRAQLIAGHRLSSGFRSLVFWIMSSRAARRLAGSDSGKRSSQPGRRDRRAR